MLNIIELEQRWLRYKIKSYVPHLIIGISLSVITIILFSFSFNNDANNLKNIDESQVNTTQHSVVKFKEQAIKQVVPVKKAIVKKQIVVSQKKPLSLQNNISKENSQKVKLSPSLDFMKKMQNSVHPYYKNETADDSYETDTNQPVQKQSVSKVPTVKAKTIQISVKQDDKHIQIKRQNTQNDIYDIIKRFKKNNNPALSLFVAKKYYELENYRQAYNYALMTNKINNEIESGWIIFSKSLVKLGKKDKAIRILKKYIKQSHSSSAQILLDEIQSGKFR